MLFDDEFIGALRDDPVRGTIALCDRTISQFDFQNTDGWTDEDFSILIESYSLLVEVIEAGLLPIKLRYPAIDNGGAEDCPKLYKYLTEIRQLCTSEETKLRVASLRNRFRASLGTGFTYEFSQGDLEKVQGLVNQLREMIAATTSLEREHQQRLLRRLEKLQAEMHKRMSDLDRFWGLIGDAGVVLGKMGTDAKPIVDRIREIADIVWQTQSRAEELPSGTKLPQLENKPTSGAEEA